MSEEQVTTGGELNHTEEPLPPAPLGGPEVGNTPAPPYEDTAAPEYPDPEVEETDEEE